jgi:predicted 2-oxoglutarate/Fe(II)-dependent dioxygenase YbiX
MKGTFRDVSGPLAKFGVTVIDEAVTDEFRRALLDVLRSADSVPAVVVSSNSSSDTTDDAAIAPDVDVAVRRTRQLTVGRLVDDRLDAYFASVTPEVAMVSRRAVATAESASCLRYGPGDYFVAHRDSPVGAGTREVDRRLVSVVLFLNGHTDHAGDIIPTRDAEPTFTGGELVVVPVEDFVDLGVAVEPVPGRLVLFPSTMVHEVKPVLSGDRFTVVTWYHA